MCVPSKKELVNKLIEAGMPAVEAEKFVENKIEAHMAKYGDELKALKFAELMVNKAIRNMSSKKYTVYEGICIGYSEIVDINAGMIKKALNMYAEDKNKAILEGYVTLDGEGNPIPLDYRTQIGNKPNPNYGKPLQSKYVQEVAFIIDNKIKIVKMEDPSFAFRTYKIYEFAGNESKDGRYIYITKERPIRDIGVESRDVVYDLALRAAAGDEWFCTVTDMDIITNYHHVVSYGNVVDILRKDNYTLYFVDDYENPRGEPIAVRAICNDDIEEDQEVVFVGKVRKWDDRITVHACGLVNNPIIDEDFIDLTEVF